MNLREAAEYLSAKGYRCSVGTVRKLARADRLKHYRPGLSGRGRMEFTTDQLDAFAVMAERGGTAQPERRPPPRLRPPSSAITPVAPPSPPAMIVDWSARMKAERGT